VGKLGLLSAVVTKSWHEVEAVVPEWARHVVVKSMQPFFVGKAVQPEAARTADLCLPELTEADWGR
jgi:hypothetical protein